MQGILVQLPHHRGVAAGAMVRRPVGFMRLPLPSVLPLRPAAISLPLSPRCASSSSSPAEESAAPASSPVDKRPSPWLFVGLGNPGTKYQGTRHNVGFDMIDAIAQAEGISLSTIQFRALVGKGQIGGSPVLLAKPQTYMNLSGESVKPLASYYKIPAERVFTIYDDLDLEFAVMRLLPKGGHGGHNGMRSILQHFSSRDIARLRIGIGRPPGQMDTQAYVLQKFSASERQELDFALDRGVEAIRLVTSEGLDKAVSTWNQVRKSKMSKMRYSNIEAN
ncbi:hypothetical protein Mapa_004814 [Marchantia paleacea]|nr:hypothetical protein Mapa_004814 [Marchantia paleacea]